MPRGRPRKEVVVSAVSEDPAADNLDKVEFEQVPETPMVEDKTEQMIPKRTDPQWSDYVMKQFSPDELEDGNPTVAGLRRVAELMLGNITSNRCRVVETPNTQNGYRAVVETEVAFDNNEDDYSSYFSDAADAYSGNADPVFARFSVALAATRSEGRALRKALRLKRVAAEELTNLPVEESTIEGNIIPAQVQIIDQLCQRNKIDVVKFINHGKEQYANYKDVPFETAKKMIQCLSEYQRKQENIPENIKGYNPNWREQ